MSHFQDKKTLEVIIDHVLAEHVRDQHPQYATFVREYLKFISQEKGAWNLVSELFSYTNIDLTLDEFVVYWKNTFTEPFPESVAPDFRFLIKNIKSFYTSKGTEKSYEFLFKVLFDSFVEFFYPKEDILRVSDGKWVEPLYLKIDDFGISFVDVVKYIDQKIIGSVSGATSFVVSFTTFEDLPANPGTFLPHYRLSTIGEGTFQAGENISIVDDTTGIPVIPVVAVVEGQGRYDGNDGFLSDKNKLQDNFFYQDFSYVLKSEVSLNFYNEIVKELIHPAGFNLFGEIRLTDEVAKDATIQSLESLFCLVIEQNLTIDTQIAENVFCMVYEPPALNNRLYGDGRYTYSWIEANRETRLGEAILHGGNQVLDNVAIGDFNNPALDNVDFPFVSSKIKISNP